MITRAMLLMPYAAMPSGAKIYAISLLRSAKRRDGDSAARVTRARCYVALWLCEVIVEYIAARAFARYGASRY